MPHDPLFENRVVFKVCVGRSGGRWLYELLKKEPDISASLERNALNDSFQKYCAWYQLPVDHGGFLAQKEKEIRSDLKDCAISFEATPWLALSTRELYDHFKSKFLFFVRKPEKVVRSLLQKGWYSEPFVLNNSKLALGFQSCDQAHHFFGRVSPKGEYFEEWNHLSRVGKIAWYWNEMNRRILNQLEELPESCWKLFRLEDLSSFDTYLELTNFMGFKPRISKNFYEKNYFHRPESNAKKARGIDSWTEMERSEFERYCEPMARRFGYAYRSNDIIDALKIPQHTVQKWSGISHYWSKLNS